MAFLYGVGGEAETNPDETGKLAIFVGCYNQALAHLNVER